MKRRPPTPINEEDSRLFREAIGAVQPFAPVAPPPAPAKPRPRARMLEADEAAVPGELLDMTFDPAVLEVGEELSYLREGYPPKLLRQLKRGQFSVQDEIDLHQMNAGRRAGIHLDVSGRGTSLRHPLRTYRARQGFALPCRRPGSEGHDGPHAAPTRRRDRLCLGAPRARWYRRGRGPAERLTRVWLGARSRAMLLL